MLKDLAAKWTAQADAEAAATREPVYAERVATTVAANDAIWAGHN